MLVKNQKLLTLVIHGTKALLYTKKYIPVCISPYLGQIRRVVDNKKKIYAQTHLQNSYFKGESREG